MLFPTIDFAIFFGVVFLGHWLLQPHRKLWKTFMVVASYVFYAWWDWHYIFLLGASTVFSQVGAVAISRAKSERDRKRLLAATLTAVLGLLFWFKYYGFFSLNLHNTLNVFGMRSSLPVLQVALPVAISFFTFMAVSYVVDVYRKDLKPAGWLDYAAYLSFFPHLVAGPIVRGHELLPQIRRRRDPRRIDYSRAAYLIFGGLFKKVVISSFLAQGIVDPVFASPGSHTSPEILFAVYGYAVQIYADFSGYTDIAIGVALLMGIEFPQNFEAPYTARSLQDFWRRWHITLSRWLRDYVYIPLGGSRGTELQTVRNVLITMVLGGLWHGAGWTFVAWGLLHGVGLAVGLARRNRRAARGLPELAEAPRAQLLQRIATFHFVCLGWLFFRADSIGTALHMLGRLFTAFGSAPLVTPLVVLVVGLAIAIQYVPKDVPERVQDWFSGLRPVQQGAVLAGALFLITSLGPTGVAPFIYFRF
ncbi:MAG TPA: MBOAT family protein [Actinomycetota bacterium]|jgi:D-alanyl-lipoteichoic acid acyltransferase DltB (MBOAT superfamily)